MIIIGFVHHSKTAPYLRDQYYLKQIGDKLQLTRLNYVKESGWECDEKEQRMCARDVNDNKLLRSLQRSKTAVFEYAYCNEWDYFFTGTISPDKFDRSNLAGFKKGLTQFFRDCRKRYNCPNLQYLIVPEKHADGVNWHVHGLLKGLPESEIQIINGKKSWARYGNKYGFNDLQVIRNHEAVSKYLTKYVTKSILDSRGVDTKEDNVYLVSRGLKRGEVIKKGAICGEIAQKPDFSNDFCDIWTFDISALEMVQSLYTISEEKTSVD